MSLAEYRKKMEDSNWAPGWEAIDEETMKLYHDQVPAHYGTDMSKRAVLGGDNYLDGYSIYSSPNGYKHIITYGMTELYACDEAFGCDESGWGYEMTLKLKEETKEDCIWAINMLSNIAFFTFTKEIGLREKTYMGGKGTSLHVGVESKITSLLFIKDTELNGIDTLHGKVEFIQLFGIMDCELNALRNKEITIDQLIENIKRDNPYFVTDMKRVKSYI